MTKVVLLRHGESVWNLENRLPGGRMWLPTEFSWRLNERHYGALQGLNKAETARKYGEEQVHIWRRSYAVRPPALEKSAAGAEGTGRLIDFALA